MGTSRRNAPQQVPQNAAFKKESLRDCQIDAVENLEWSLKETRPRALIQMASGSGKTFTAVTEAYRLIKYGNAKRVLFLVDRNNLAKQTLTGISKLRRPLMTDANLPKYITFKD